MNPGEDKNSVDLIGFHGHTIDHRPHEGVTTQIGDGKLLSQLTGISVVNDFRSEDVRKGGQGAPLVPIYHKALFENEEKPVAIVNIGGVANVTWIGKNEEELLAFDTGPGNALIDDLIKAKTGNNFDKGGNIAKSGKVNAKILNEFMENDFFTKKPPKSLDRNHFTPISKNNGISTEDAAATYAAFTAKSIAISANFFPSKPSKWVIAGGGRYNMAIMDALKNSLQNVVTSDELGINGDVLEAQAFAFLAVRSLLNLPNSFPGTTGTTQTVSGGVINSVKDHVSS